MDSFFLLIADDHPDMTRLLEASLKATYGAEVRSETATTVPEIEHYLRAGQPMPNLLLLDYHLKPNPYKAPHVLSWIKQQLHLETLVVDVWSSMATEAEVAICLELGARRYHAKPKAFSDLVGFARQLIA